MIKYYAKDYGIMPNMDASKGLIKLFNDLQKASENKEVIFEKGTYYINSKNCEKHSMYVTNTVGNNEYKKGEERHNVPVPFYLENTKNLVINGNDSTFIMNGKCTSMAFINCENIVLENLELTHLHPDIHELKVVSKSPFSVEFLADKNTIIENEKGKLYFNGEGYHAPITADSKFAWWNAYIDAKTPDKIVRYRHPLGDAFGIKYLGDNHIKAHYLNTARFKLNDRYYIFNNRRDFVGIFVDRCKNFEIKNVKQRVSYSLALVCQNSENILVDSVEFAPKDEDFKMSSVADFIQLCMCRGDIIVKDSYFDGAGDDLLNVHGMHFEIVKRDENKLTVAFKHPQSHGYNAFRVGDKIAYIDKDSMLEKDTSTITSSKLVNEDEIEITVDKLGDFVIGDVVENIDACPNLLFKNNKSTRIITRGLLITTRGKVVIENNDFKSTSMSGILLSDDAKSWYESGMCKNVTIKDNKFHYCAQTPVLIKPENSVHKGAVHTNITIENNEFDSYDNECINAKSSSNITVKNNTFVSDNIVKYKNCENVVVEDNKVLN